MIGSSQKITLPLFKVFLPYLLLIVFLIAGKFLLGSAGLSFPLLIKHNFAYFNPGFAFIVAGIASILIFGIGTKLAARSVGISLKRSIEPFLVLAFMSAIAQIMVNSAHNLSTLPSMVDFLAVHVKNALLPLWAPVVGAFGSFLTGSATVSNLMFGNFLAAGVVVGKIQFGAAGAIQALGENAGNGGLAGAARPAEQVGVGDAVLGHGVSQRLGDVLLAHYLTESLRPILSGDDLVRHVPRCPVNQTPGKPRQM